MKVNGNGAPRAPAALGVVGNEGRKAEPKKGSTGQGPDRVQVSTAARVLNEARVSKEPVDTKKVRALRTAIQNGTFRVDPEKIAHRMLQEER